MVTRTIPKKLLFEALDASQKVVTLKGKAYFANVHKYNPGTFKKYNKMVYNVTIGIEDEGEIAKLKEIGLQVRDANEYVPLPHIQVKRSVKDANRENPEADKPDIVDSKQQPIPPSILIGNGSDVIVRFGTFWYEAQGGGIGTSLWKMRVTNLVPYSRGDDPIDQVDEGGFSVDSQSSQSSQDLDDDLPF